MKILLIVFSIIAVITFVFHLIKAKAEIFFGETKRVVVKLLCFKFDTSKLKKSRILFIFACIFFHNLVQYDKRNLFKKL